MDAARERLDWTRDWDGEEQAQLSRRDLLEAYLNPDNWEELARACGTGEFTVRRVAGRVVAGVDSRRPGAPGTIFERGSSMRAS